MTTKSTAKGLAYLFGTLIFAQAHAAFVLNPDIYPSAGTENPDTYHFTATSSGTLSAYFAGSNAASYNEEIGIFVNGKLVAEGLNDHTANFGGSISTNVTAGESIVIKDFVQTTGNTWSNIVSQNNDGVNHVYATKYTSGQIPGVNVNGIYLGFEDLAGSFPPDYNYTDETLVLTNAQFSKNVPEPATLLLMVIGLSGFFLLNRNIAKA